MRSKNEMQAQKTNGRPVKTPALYKMQLFLILLKLNFILHPQNILYKLYDYAVYVSI